MPKIHKVMFGAGIVMWMLSSAHLGLVIQQVTHEETPLRNAQAQVSIATIQVIDTHCQWLITVFTQNILAYDWRYDIALACVGCLGQKLLDSARSLPVDAGGGG